MSKKRFPKTGLLLLAALASQPVQAATRACTVTFTNATVDLAGNLYVSGNDTGSATYFSWQQICNVTSTVNNVGVESCKSWFATALTAVSSGKSAIIFFDDTAMAGRTNCANMPSWNTFYIQYLGLNN